MAGTNTHNYDLVMEFAEGALSKMLEPLFGGEGGLLANLVSKIPGLNTLSDIFTIDVLFDRPSDIGLPASAPNPLDIRINVGLGGASGQIRIVVPLDVDRATNPDEDIIQLDFVHVHWVGAKVIVPSIPPVMTRLMAVENWVKTQTPLKLPGFKVDRATTDSMTLNKVDVTIIDDASGNDNDAVAFCLTYGGGAGSGLQAFTTSLIPGGETGAVAIFFGWLCRIISPKIAQSLGVDDATFSNCNLNKSVSVGDGAKLTKLKLKLDNGFIKIEAEVKKSGFCYDAKGTVSGKIMIKVEAGRLVVQSEMGDPDVDVDIPWYCYLAVAVIGLALGGLLGGVIGGIIGGIITPIILYIVQEVIEGTMNKIVDAIADKINGGLPDFDVPAYGINFIFQEVHIDDITVLFHPVILDNSPVRCAGTIKVSSGQAVDLDTGLVGNLDLPGMDLSWTGSDSNRKLSTICITELGRTYSTSFEGQTRYSLYRPVYTPMVSVPLSELLIVEYPWYWPFGIETPTRLVYGILTNEKRLAVIQIVEVEDNYIILRYRTYDTISPMVRLLGGFNWRASLLELSPESISYTPLLPPKSPEERIKVLNNAINKKLVTLRSTGEFPVSFERHEKNETLKTMLSMHLTTDIIKLGTTTASSGKLPLHEALQLASPRDCRVGEWVGTFKRPIADTGWFVANTIKIKAPATYYWYVNGVNLSSIAGQVSAGQQTFDYTLSGKNLTLKAKKNVEVIFELKVKVVGNDGTDVEATRCITYKPSEVVLERTLPDLEKYLSAFQTNFGINTENEVCHAEVLHS